MRSIHRGHNIPRVDYAKYEEAFVELVSRLGIYCSYCERRISTNLAVEHIQPKGLPAYEHLEGRWENFLLACVNCNSTKGVKDVALEDVLLPDRDNTSSAYVYMPDGRIEIDTHLTPRQKEMAIATLALVGLDKPSSGVRDMNDQLIAVDRVLQRVECWEVIARIKKGLLKKISNSDIVRDFILELALQTGFFSIWMAGFANDPEQRRLFIERFPGTAKDCYDTQTANVCPRPRNGLPFGGKS